MKEKKNGAFLILLLGASLLLSACVGSQTPSLLHEETSEHVIAENLPAWCENMKDFTALAESATFMLAMPVPLARCWAFPLWLPIIIVACIPANNQRTLWHSFKLHHSRTESLYENRTKTDGRFNGA